MLPKNVYMKLSHRDKLAVKRNLVKGSGAYDLATQPYGYYGQKIGQAIGAAKYGAPGGFVGGHLGGFIGHRIGKAMGSGRYSLKNPTGFKAKRIAKYRGAHKMIRNNPGSGCVVTESNSPPSFGSNKTVIRHREFIGNVLSSTVFTLNTYNVNPGDETTFPWLAGIASNYQKYRPRGVLFEFKSTSANALNSTNTALGTVMGATSYNAIASVTAPTSKMEMLQLEGCVSVCPADSAMFPVECAKNYNPLTTLYVRNGIAFQVPNGAEQFYDLADFYLATEGMQQANVVIGELWATYEFELITPVLNSGQVGNTVNSTQYAATTGISASNYFGSNIALNTGNFNLSFTSTSIIMPAGITTGTYILTWVVYGGSVAMSYPNVAFTSNCRAVNAFFGNTNDLPYPGTATASVMTIVKMFKVTGPNAVLTFSGGTLPTAITNMDLLISQVPNDLYP